MDIRNISPELPVMPQIAASYLPVTCGAAKERALGGAGYNCHGSGPLTLELGQTVLAEFACSGEIAPSLPTWLNDGKRLSAPACCLKERLPPPLYREAMLKGHE